MIENPFLTKDIPKEFIIQTPVLCHHILIDGELVKWNGAMQNVISPIFTQKASGEIKTTILGQVPDVDTELSLKALTSAEKAYDNGKGIWPTSTFEARMLCVEHFMVDFVSLKSEIVKLLMWEIGKPLIEAEDEFERTISYVSNTLDYLKSELQNKSKLQYQDGVYAQIKSAPLGVVFCMGPYNYPLNEAFCLLIPALLMGNTCIYKPASHGVLSIAVLLQAFKNTFPKGVVNIIFGRGHNIAAPLMKSGKIDALALIGNSKAANALLGLHPKPNRLKLVLGLEAKNAAVVLADADIDLAVNECVLGSVAFNGQRCTALKIIYVHQSVRAEFNEKFCAKIEALKYGQPWEEGVRLTALPEPDKPKYIQNLIADALSKGAKILNNKGGKQINNFIFPAVLFPVSKTMRVFYEEQFGPVVPIAEFKAVEAVIADIEASNYGQQISLFTTKLETLNPLIRIFSNLVSRVNINSKCQRGPDIYPFVGRKDSAVSTLGVSDALTTFSIKSMVSLKESNNSLELIKAIFKPLKKAISNTKTAF